MRKKLGLLGVVLCLLYSFNGLVKAKTVEINHLRNSSFEYDLRDHENVNAWGSVNYGHENKNIIECTNLISHDGQKSLKIKMIEPKFTGVVQGTQNGLAKHFYKISGWVKTENLQTSNNNGAMILVAFSKKQEIQSKKPPIEKISTKSIIGNTNWTYIETIFKTPDSLNGHEIRVYCCLGYFGGKVSGTAYYDDIKLEPIQGK